MDPNRFFGHHIDALTLGGKAAALVLTVVLSGLVGLERQWRGQPAGLRTHILVGLGTTVITLTSIEYGIGGTIAAGDPARITAQIVSGVGFLGAGAIMRDGATVHGLTTAASIWSVAAIGIAVGSSPRLGELAVVATVIVLATLVVLNRLEDLLHLKQRPHVLTVLVREADNGAARLMAVLAEQGIVVEGAAFKESDSTTPEPRSTMRLTVRLPAGFDRARCVKLLAGNSSVVSMELD